MSPLSSAPGQQPPWPCPALPHITLSVTRTPCSESTSSRLATPHHHLLSSGLFIFLTALLPVCVYMHVVYIMMGLLASLFLGGSLDIQYPEGRNLVGFLLRHVCIPAWSLGQLCSARARGEDVGAGRGASREWVCAQQLGHGLLAILACWALGSGPAPQDGVTRE